MAEETTQPPQVSDPDGIPETMCDGLMNLHFVNDTVGILTFTHARPKAGPLFVGRAEPEFIVRARIAIQKPNLIALRDLLTNMLDKPDAERVATAGGSTKH